MTVMNTILALYVIGGLLTTFWYAIQLGRATKTWFKIGLHMWAVTFVFWPIMFCYMVFFTMLNRLLNGSKGY